MIYTSTTDSTYRHLLRAAWATAASSDLQQVAQDALAPIAVALHASFVALYEVTDAGLKGYVPPQQDGSLFDLYTTRHLATDPCQEIKRRLNPRIAVVTDLVDANAYRRSAVYNELYSLLDMESHLVVRLNDRSYSDTGVVAMLLSRSKKQPSFSTSDREALGHIIPAFSGLVRRSAFSDSAQAAAQTLAGDAACFILGGGGNILWLSTSAERYCVRSNGRASAPEGIVSIADRLLAAGQRSLPPPTSTSLQWGSERIAVHFRLSTTSSGGKCVLVEMAEPAADSTETSRVLESYGLTRSECVVMLHLSQGLSNADIAKRLFNSPETVRTHLRHIFRKLDVKSRLEAVTKVERLTRERGKQATD